MDDSKKQIDELITITAEKGGSDLHLSPGNYPTIRVDGRLIPLIDKPILNRQLLEGLTTSLMNQEQKDKFAKDREIDFAYELESQRIRCRINIYMAQGSHALVSRFIPEDIKTLEELNLPSVLNIFTKLSQGFVLVTGPNGHGKSTTLASLIDTINKTRAEKIITIEDPIEYIYVPKKSIIDQRELYADTNSFGGALRSTFRENVNVIMVGEMRDFETVSAAVNAAETGHLVFASLHTNSAAQTIERIIDFFPPHQQSQIISQLANTISGVVSQRLVPRNQGGLIPAVEVMIANAAVRNLIRENKIQQLNFAIQTGSDVGMMSLNQSLADLVRRGEISLEQAEFYSPNTTELKTII